MADDNSVLGFLTPSSAVGLGMSVIQTIGGLLGQSSDKKDMEKLLSQRKAYATPEEIFKILQATQNNASSGFDANTLNYLTTQNDRAFAGTTGAAERLGADPNDLSALFDLRVMQTMKIGSESHAENMKNFSSYLGALGTVGENKAAEQKSEQDILKDKIQAKAGELRTDSQNINNGINGSIGSLAAGEAANLYKERSNGVAGAVKPASSVVASGTSGYTKTQWDELASILNYSGDKSWASKALPYND